MQVLTTIEDEAIAACRASGEYFWLDLASPSAEELRSLGTRLGWNPLLTEDLEHGDQRPKVEDFDDHVLVICYSATYEPTQQQVTLLEHGVVVHGDYLVTVRQVDTQLFTALREHLDGNDAGVSEAAVVHRILDLVVDTTTDVADRVSDEVDRLELAIDDDVSDGIREALRTCRRQLVSLRGTAVAQHDALASLIAAFDAIPGFEVGMRSHFRDITDHSRRAVDRLDVARDLLDAAFEAYHATLVARQGAVSQRLTVIATIFLPLSFVTGFFGQNFTWMVDHVESERDFLVFGVGSTVATGLLLAILFRRLRWW